MNKKIRLMNLTKGARIERRNSATYGKTKKIITLRAQGLTFREIGKILGIKENALATRYRKLMKSETLKKD